MSLAETPLRAIVRDHVPGQAQLVPGMICQALSLDKELSSAKMSLYVDCFGNRFWASNEWFLALSRFLYVQPFKNFWCLLDCQKRQEDPSRMFLSDARTVQFGAVPFRFESRGELYYYLKEYFSEFNLDNYIVGQFESLTQKTLEKLVDRL